MIYKQPHWIQRLSSRSRDNQIRFTERYHADGMGNSYFEQGYMADALRQMDGIVQTAVFQVEGNDIYAAWNPNHYDAEGAEYVISKLWNERFLSGWWVEECTYFRQERLSEQRAFEKQRLKQKKLYAINAWFDIEHGLFWTWEKINLKDIALNIAKQAAWSALSVEERRAEIFALRGNSTLGAKLGPLKDQLIKAGKLPPR